MCGIAGIVTNTKTIALTNQIKVMTDAISHRGPDDEGHFVYQNVALGQRRLSIIDLSPTGHQPMSTLDERYTLIFNGEIYNHLELRQELKLLGYTFKGSSDSETILYGFEKWHTSFFSRLNGIFAIALYDKREQKLYLVRDRFGIKPIYVANTNIGIYFASEIKAILSCNSLNKINSQGLHEFLYYGNALGKHTMFDEVVRVLPGQIWNINTINNEIHKEFYWKIEDVSERDIEEQEAIDRTKYLLDNAVKRQLLSDVPIGIFLSGGVDSSAITCFASKHYSSKLNSYSAGFDFEGGHNELPLAAEVAKKYNTNHHEFLIKGQDISSLIEHMVYHHDEPFSDAANIPLYLLTKYVKGESTVILQGDGGDELFAGYPRYNMVHYFNTYKYLINLVKPFVTLLPNLYLRNKIKRFSTVVNEKNQAYQFAKFLTVESEENSPLKVISQYRQHQFLNTNPFERYNEVYEQIKHVKGLPQQLLWLDTQIILPDQFLEKVDKSTMANSIEVRVPFLDNDLAEFALSIPGHLKVKNGEKKYILKKALEGVVEHKVLYGPKKGFGVPYAAWIDKPLRSFFMDTVFSKDIKDLEFFNYKTIDELMNKDKNSFLNNGFILWKILNLSIWLKKYKMEF
jgi:asparagine synthase (glutamine-hydrolysing)